MSVQIDLTGRVALVTGGTKGVGAGIATVFLRAGAEVYVCSRHEPDELPVVEGRTARFVPADVRDPDQVDAVVETVRDESGRLDTLVNNAGGAPPTDTLSASMRFHSKIVELNLLAPLTTSRCAWPMLRDSGGSIVMISSIAATRPAPGVASYGAAKAGLANLTRTLAWEFAPHVRVNAITLGLARTEAFEEHYGADDGGATAAIPLGRAADPVDVGNTCVFLASPLAAYVSGAQLAVDGGGESPGHLAAFTRSDHRAHATS
ncbi:SDR family oxidoreductase [Allosaccharopolyspora coralli]|uniref:SDR family oxidoreductase n=1 Tax=Allosaccharopolyspora coralli TaxID=2665642 RepID=A0A5Q3QFM9_9PSEU|nr:SDR family oxidoreductase [Allosaccharopolyspora coralli]QGK70335.1 SDR family oxidoreductase [Allosaccharopolyspora coralli]